MNMSSRADSPAGADEAAVSAFPYLEVEAAPQPAWHVEAFGEDAGAAAEKQPCETSLAEQLARAEASGYERGRTQAEAAAKAALAEALSAQRGHIAEALRQFEREKQQYLSQVEAEIIQLALAIARRVLEHEASVDTLLLVGAVRASLERLSRTSKITVVVHPAAAARWQKALLDCHAELEFAEDAALPPEGCVLQCSVGTTEFSLRQQLKEVERSFGDLLARRPAAAVRVH